MMLQYNALGSCLKMILPCCFIASTAILFPLSVSSATQGDINNDGKIDTSEAIYALQVAAGLLPVICNGSMNGTRWCNNGNGTVTDLTTGLVWLRDATWGFVPHWVGTIEGLNAHDKASEVKDGVVMSIAGVPTVLSDDSVEGDWRLPTKSELKALIEGVEPVSSTTPRAFNSVLPSPYWTSTVYISNTMFAWTTNPYTKEDIAYTKNTTAYVWPVRNGN